ncbi:hypothetical protein GV791_22435 [Nocardia cyriacigeorgica]|uniref:Uncharacterized protein n=2 Tax=Nocardia cyriacigeorgica TaxID=135487 RepID=A0A6P1CRX8_9NOCA
MTHEVLRGVAWPYPDGQFPQHLGIVVHRTVLEGEEPARLVTHWDDGDWTMADGVNDPNGNAALVCVEHMVAMDDTLAPLATMPPGTQAWRWKSSDPWTIEPHEIEAQA